MIKAIIAAVIIGVVAIIGASFYFSKPAPIASVPSFAKPWLEVIMPSVFELDSKDESKVRELRTGDEISEGAVVGVFGSGVANLHFPDGSVLRIDSGTRFVMEEGSFNPESDALRVKINLLIGRVWSRIISLATPDSIWEVKTATAVATVRGTAFGMEYDGNAVSVVGSENTVAVTAIDPETKELIKEASVIVEPNKIVEFKKEDVSAIKRHIAARESDVKAGIAAAPAAKAGPLLVAREAPRAVLEKDWIKRAKDEDAKLNTKIKSVRERIKNEKEARQEIRKSLREDFKEEIEKKLEARDILNDQVIEKRTADEAVVPPVESALKPAPTLSAPEPEIKTEVQINTSAVSPTIKVAESRTLTIKPSRDFSRVIEGEVVIFSAVLDGGANQDVTVSAQWQVIGDIGAMGKPGVFTAHLGSAIAELGEASGAIVATWKDPETGELFIAKTPIFKVEAKIDLNFEQRG